jgi:hypothetical protein
MGFYFLPRCSQMKGRVALGGVNVGRLPAEGQTSCPRGDKVRRSGSHTFLHLRRHEIENCKCEKIPVPALFLLRNWFAFSGISLARSLVYSNPL